jgi:ribosome-associated toxin RatA of RatAB toxin-antitoxin module
MFTCQDSITIDRERAHVFHVAETYPHFVRFYRRGEILHQDDETIKVKVGAKFFGVPTSWIGEGIKKRYEAIEFTQTQGLFKGLVALWTFKDSGRSTIVSIKIKFSFDFPIVGRFLEHLLGEKMVAKTIQGILKELKRESESASVDRAAI